MPASPARTAAFHILLRVEQAASYASELLHSSPHAGLSIADHGLTTELVMGVLRWRSLLDTVIGRVSSQKVRKLDVEVLTALRLGAYQLGWLDRVPARAAIHESVELVKSARKRSAAPLVNAVLRKLAESPESLRVSKDVVASAPGWEVLAAASAHPEWLVQRWTSELGLDLTRHICSYDQLVPPTTIRLRMPSTAEELRAEGIELEGGALLANARRVLSGDVTKTKAFAEGRIAIQDEASQLVAALVGKGSRILDCCAAPGGKTWAIADRNPQSTILAAELHPHRAESLRKRVGARNVEVIAGDILELPVGELFNRVLVDVPCSGTGTLARHPEIKWRLEPSDLDDLHSRQAAILRSAMKHVASGGKLIYSTCSLEREENETVVEESLRANQSFRLIGVSDELQQLRENGELIAGETTSLVRGSFLHTTPGVQRCDGFFAAVLERQAF